MAPYDDEDEKKDEALKMLGGEVDDYAGEQLQDPDAPSGGKQGVTIEISVKPHGATAPDDAKDEDGAPSMDADSEDHDPIAHILGMCRGGCAE